MICRTCTRDVPVEIMERHHLNTRRKDADNIELICRPCHRQIHVLFRNSDLRDPTLGLDTIEGLLEDARFSRFVAYVKKIPVSADVTVRESSRVRRRK